MGFCASLFRFNDSSIVRWGVASSGSVRDGDAERHLSNGIRCDVSAAFDLKGAGMTIGETC